MKICMLSYLMKLEHLEVIAITGHYVENVIKAMCKDQDTVFGCDSNPRFQ
jgi:hypothetical protein